MRPPLPSSRLLLPDPNVLPPPGGGLRGSKAAAPTMVSREFYFLTRNAYKCLVETFK